MTCSRHYDTTHNLPQNVALYSLYVSVAATPFQHRYSSDRHLSLMERLAHLDNLVYYSQAQVTVKLDMSHPSNAKKHEQMHPS